LNLQHYIFGRRTPEFKAPHLLVAEHLNLKPHICLAAEHLILKISSKYEPFFVDLYYMPNHTKNQLLFFFFVSHFFCRQKSCIL